MRRLQQPGAKGSPGRGIRVASFFSGGGGLDLGFHLAGFNIVYANDSDHNCCETLAINANRLGIAGLKIQHGDIRDLAEHDLPKNIDLVIGGPPCQSFSASGRRAGGAAGRLDDRGNLFEAYCRIIRFLSPNAFLFENVRGILGTHQGKDWAKIVNAFKRIGYSLSYRILDACDYGIPQHRERLILVGHKLTADFLFPEPWFGPDSAKRTPHLSPAESFQHVKHEEKLEALVVKGGKYSRLLPLVPPGENYLFFTAKRGYRKPIFAYRSRFSDFLYKANPSQPIKTLIASPGKYTGPFHWENRQFSIGEYKRLQGFPEDYRFAGTRREIVKQIGNSVSPYIATALAHSIAGQVFRRPIMIPLMDPLRPLSFDKRKGQKAHITRRNHDKIAQQDQVDLKSVFTLRSYQARTWPCELHPDLDNVDVTVEGKNVEMKVQFDDSGQTFARVELEINRFEPDLFTPADAQADAFISLHVLGSEPRAIQAMWNAVDDFVIRCSKFHSLFELYGHFTEPHPILKVKSFVGLIKHPIVDFAAHAANFENCSRYFERGHLVKIFGKAFGTDDFGDIVETLREYRFDIRCHETNIAIPKSVYMVAYPFTLPSRRQMNFSFKRAERELAVAAN